MYYNACSTVDTNHVAICDNASYTINGNVYRDPGHYIDTMINNGCDSVVHTILTHNPTYSIGVSDSIYEGGVYDFLGNVYSQEGIYHHRLTSSLGCDSNIALSLKVIPVERIFVDTLICEYDYYYFGNRKYNTQGIHVDTFVYNDHHEILVLNLNIRKKPNVTVGISARDINDLCIGEDIVMTGKGAIRYEWYKLTQPLKELFSRNEVINGWVYDSLTHLMLRGFDDLGCYNDFAFDLAGRNCCSFFIPNAFTPNGDGLNDEFKIIGIQPRSYFLKIYNRYGQLVFSSENINQSWSGNTSSGDPVATDVYSYILQGECYDGTEIKEKGDITILR